MDKGAAWLFIIYSFILFHFIKILRIRLGVVRSTSSKCHSLGSLYDPDKEDQIFVELCRVINKPSMKKPFHSCLSLFLI